MSPAGEIPPQMLERIWTTVEESTDRSLRGLIMLPIDDDGNVGYFGVWNREGQAVSMLESEVVEVMRQVVENSKKER